MLGCSTRGYSFTRALLGIAADELHLCGDPAAVPLVQEMLKITGDEVEVLKLVFFHFTFKHSLRTFFLFSWRGWVNGAERLYNLFLIVISFSLRPCA